MSFSDYLFGKIIKKNSSRFFYSLTTAGHMDKHFLKPFLIQNTSWNRKVLRFKDYIGFYNPVTLFRSLQLCLIFLIHIYIHLDIYLDTVTTKPFTSYGCILTLLQTEHNQIRQFLCKSGTTHYYSLQGYTE